MRPHFLLTRQPNRQLSHGGAPVSLARIAQLCAVLSLMLGCRGPQRSAPVCATSHSACSPNATGSHKPQSSSGQVQRAAAPPQPAAPAPPPVSLASARSPLPEAIATPGSYGQVIEDPISAADELALPPLVDGVLARNQSLQAMYATWRAATEKYPQAVSLEDPMFTSAIGPASFGVPNIAPGYLAGASQKLPWFGKRYLRGNQARAEANGALMDVADMRLQLIEATQTAYYQYYLAVRQSDLNADNIRALKAFREDARQRYEANLVTQQDVLQADVELALLERRQVELARNRGIAVARINTLLHRPPDCPLAPPPRGLPAIEQLPPADELRQVALASRPDLAAIGARLRAEQSSLALANKDYLPDLEVMGRYDAFWQEPQLRAMVGVNANVPIYRERLNAAVREAMFRISQKRAEYRQRMDDINREVQTAYEQMQAATELVELYRRRIIPAARQNVDSARAGYMAGRVDFLRLIEAERQLIDLLQEQEDLIAQYHVLRAELERVAATPLEQVRAAE